MPYGDKAFKGHADLVYSPDDGGYYADLLWKKKIDCPIFNSQQEAKSWAEKHGATHFHINH